MKSSLFLFVFVNRFVPFLVQRHVRVLVTMLLVASVFLFAHADAALPVFAPPELVLRLPTTGNSGILAAEDFTGDGLLDVVFARYSFQTSEVFPLRILINDGSGRFVDGTATIFVGPPPVVQNPTRVIIADFNGDGRPDIFISDHGIDLPPYPGFQNQLALSTSDGRLVNATANLPQQVDYTYSAATADIDGDGDLDLFIGNFFSNFGTPSAGWDGPQIWLNDGTGRFTVAPGRLPPEQTLRFWTGHFADVNRDGKPDLILGTAASEQDSVVLLNDGMGFFSLLPNAMPPKPFATTALQEVIKSTDLNGDGFPDLLVAVIKDTLRGRWIQILINNGNGTFRDETATRLPQADNNDEGIVILELRDLDGDGDLDIATWLGPNHLDPPPFYLNNGNGVFTQLPLSFGEIATRTATGHSHNLYVFLDADGDGGRDILTTFPGCDCFPFEDHFIVRDIGPVIAPATPTDVLASDGHHANKVRLTWSYVWGATSYQVWRVTGTGSAGTLIGTTTRTTFDDTTGARGLHYYFVVALNSAGNSALSSPDKGFLKTVVAVDSEGDGKSDIAVYRAGTWFILRSLDGGVTATGWGGLAQDVPVPADYDGDGKTDIAVYREGNWYIIRSSDGGVLGIGWGGLPQDVPVPADYDGDGRTDIAVYRSGTWFILRSSDGGVTTVGWGGLAQDKPVPADYDGDGKVDVAVYRDGSWFILRSSDGGGTTIGWGGLAQDKPVPADYDEDGKTDIAVYRDGTWFIIQSSDGGVIARDWGGLPQDIPVPADYDGDGKADVAVYRNGMWFIIRSSDGGFASVGWGGLAQDIPLN
jgi:hypothetical protein